MFAALTLSLSASAGARAAIPTHIPTWAFDDNCNAGGGTSARVVRDWLSYARTACGVSAGKAHRDCHAPRRTYCSVIQYLDTAWTYVGDPGHLYSRAPDSWFLHAPRPRQSQRIYDRGGGGGYLLNQNVRGVRRFYHNFVLKHFNSDDGLLMDWQGAGLASELYYSTCGCRSTYEIRTNPVLRAAHKRMSAAMLHRNGSRFLQIDNALASNPYLPQGLENLNSSLGVRGLLSQGQPESNGTFDPFYSTLLDQIAYVATRTRGFVVSESYGASGAPYQAQSRRVQEATMLLGYSPGHLVDDADLEADSQHLAVWPEEGIYPTHALQTMGAPRGRGCLRGRGKVCVRGGHNSLRVAPGVYRREFTTCYDRGRPVGRCAALVNSTGHTVIVRSSWLKQRFTHLITFNGGDVQSGGALDLRGAPFGTGSSPIPPHDAVVIAG